MRRCNSPSLTLSLLFASLVALLVCLDSVQARPPIRRNFFTAYPEAVGTRLDLRQDGTEHCGVCHFNFDGGGPRNPYGQAVEATPDRTPEQILALGPGDADNDGAINNVEILDPNMAFDNTPTFPGLTAGNVGNVSNIDPNEILDYLTPSAGGPDTEPPVVTVTFPIGGESLGSSSQQTIQWTATDNSGTVVSVDVSVSFDGGVEFEPLANEIGNTGSLTWFVQNRPTTQALIKVEAVDPSGNDADDQSDAFFEIFSSASGRVPTTLRDFDMPGTQPVEALPLNDPSNCRTCHGNYDPTIEPYFNWYGSMMAQASIDPVFLAALEVANQDAPESGDLCLRCHDNRGWLAGRSTPTDASQMQQADLIGVSCDLCHRMVDPVFDPNNNPAVDAQILSELDDVPTAFTAAQYVVDPAGNRRGPFADALPVHPFLESPFHRESAFCGTCHDVSNPVFVRDPNGNYVPNGFDAPASSFGPDEIGPVERTYSEWVFSGFNTMQGVDRPEFGGIVRSCQDCHMRDVTGQGCNDPNAPLRPDLPLHDMTGGNAWVPGILDQVDPNVNVAALQAGIDRARGMLRKAAQLDLRREGEQLIVGVTNRTGHKLPTGYPEGRRIWINVRFLAHNGSLISESGAYDPNTAELTHDPEVKIYEVVPVVGENIAPVVGLPANTEFHFALNNKTLSDNRIPPEGFTNADYEAVGAAPVGATYADGQNYDETVYTIPPGAFRAVVTLYYQSVSKEFAEFLLDNSLPGGAGEAFYNLWAANGKCPPERMARARIRILRNPVNIGDVGQTGFTGRIDIP
jgi:hypothetical protein